MIIELGEASVSSSDRGIRAADGAERDASPMLLADPAGMDNIST
jgi:hypothetical protein